MIELLFVLLLFNFIYAIKSSYAFINPATSFIIGLMCAVLISIVYKEEWGMDRFHWNTFGVIAIGVFVFNIVCTCTQSKYKIHKLTIIDWQKSHVLGDKTLFAFVIVVALTTVWEYQTKLNLTGTANIGEAMFEMDQEYKYGDSKLYQIPIVLRNLILLRTAISIYFLYFFAKMLALKIYEKRNFIFIIIICLIGVFGSFLSGSRGNVVTLLLYTFFVWTIFKTRCSKTFRLLNIKKTIYISLALLLGGTMFVKSTEWVGREFGEDPSYYFAVYCGAEIKNLDIFMNEKIEKNRYFGEATFRNLMPKEKDFEDRARDFIQFRYHNGYFLGNVYTIFQSLYNDFGYTGVVILIGFMAFIMQYLFIKALNRLHKKPFDMWVCLYAYLSPAVVNSFFGNSFYNLLSSWMFIKLFIEVQIIAYIIERMFLRKNRSFSITNTKTDAL